MWKKCLKHYIILLKPNTIFNSGCTASNANPYYIMNIKLIIQTSVVTSKCLKTFTLACLIYESNI